MIPELGQWALCLALGVSLLLSVLPLWGAHKHRPEHMALARPLARILFVLVGAGFKSPVLPSMRATAERATSPR